MLKMKKMLRILHSASMGHQLGTCTLNGFRRFNPNTQVQARPPNGAQLNGKNKKLNVPIKKQKIKNHEEG